MLSILSLAILSILSLVILSILSLVILSVAKDLARWAEMLHCAQHDSVYLTAPL